MSEASYTSELRFGVVMYGGVSLALYINGVANELFEACCASPKDGSVAPGGSGSRVVYRKLSWLLANPGLRALARRHAKGEGDDPFDASGTPRDAAFASERQRFVVDVIAGTSAGGINGVFLAKALANGQPFAPLQQLWVDEGDIGLLLNDARSTKNLPLPKPTQPASLLNSDRMYLKLLEAMENMERADPALPAAAAGRSPLADEIDLFVTTTDIEGAVVPLRLFDKVVHERRHRQVFRFRYAEPQAAAQPPRSDFRAADSPFLAFAARCTSSFPFAFEPMTLKDAERVCAARGTPQDFAQRQGFFTGLGAADLAGDGWMKRPFGDGGYLDNKPFTHAVEALSKRQAVLPIERKLIYVEPAPAHPENEARSEGKPHALANAVAALTAIPQYETIREDLQAVLKRNRRIERVERMVRMVESDVESHPDDPFARLLLKEGQVPDWSALDLGAMLDYYGSSFLPYRRLRLNTVSDELAHRLALRWGVDPSGDLSYALRALVRAWREERYYDHFDQRTATQTASVNAFLADFDRSYRRRRAAFLMRKTQQLLRMLPRWAGLSNGSEPPGEGEQALLNRLRRHGGDVMGFDAARLHAALLALRQGLALTLRSLREQGAVAAAPDAERRQLDSLLRLLLGEAVPVDSLPGVDGQPVPVKLEAIRPPSSHRTLQQNVFDRAQDLFKLARAGRRTQLQTLLEADLEAMRLQEGSESTVAQGLALLRDLLGRPELKPEVHVETLADGTQRETSRVVVVVDAVPAALPWAAVLNTREGETLRKLLAEYRSRFDEFDQVAFPLYYDTSTGEPSTVEVVRVSPEDAPSLVQHRPSAERQKLAGTALFNFGGFLDANWRRNDILWGRLDGAERLLAALLPGEEDEALRDTLLAEAQRAILRESLSSEAHDELVSRFTAALRESGQPSLQQAFDKLWAQLGGDDEARHSRVGQALRAVLGDAGLLAWARDEYRVKRELPTGPMLETAARAVTITGRVLQGIEQQQRVKAQRAVWLTRAGLALQALLALSLPGSLAANVVRHWVHRIYVFAALLFGGGLLLSSPTARNFGLGVLVLVAVVDLLLRIAGDAQHRRWGWLKFAVGLILTGVLALAAVGLIGLLKHGPTRWLGL